MRTLVVPRGNAREASVVDGLEVVGAATLHELIGHLRGEEEIAPTRVEPEELLSCGGLGGPDFSDVRGHEHVKRALEVAAAGGHNVLLLGPPGSGKTMLARRIPGILPPLTVDEALEVTEVHSVAGRLSPGRALVSRRPFRAPHHTTSDAGLVGGGAPPVPGEVSLAHHGVLFLDEMPEFRRHVLEVLRQPLEDGHVTLSRARFRVRYPARFILVGAMNPCPCGFRGDGTDRCTCDPGHVARYRSRVSGPLLDRIDLHMSVGAVTLPELVDTEPAEPSEAIRDRVVRARKRQLHRFRGVEGVFANGQMGVRQIRRFCAPSKAVSRMLRRAVDSLGLSARGYHRILKVARTVADLAGSEAITKEHAAEAVQYRRMGRGEMV